MSVCFETSNVLATQVSTSSSSPQLLEDTSTSSQSSTGTNNNNNVPTPVSASVIQTQIVPTVIQTGGTDKPEQLPAPKSIAKLVVANHPSVTSNQVLQKVVNPPLITVLNPSGPLTVVKTLCVTSGVSSAPQFTLVNSAPLNVTNAVGKTPTITLLNAPVTVVKAITAQNVEKAVPDVTPNVSGVVPSNTSPVPAIIENRGHNVFVKNTCPDSTVTDVPQGHKLLTANNFPQTNVLTNINPAAKTVNGQRSKLKILSNVVMPGTSQAANNVLLNKTNTQRYMPRQKILGGNAAAAAAKYINKPSPNNVIKSAMNATLKQVQDKSPTRMVYPTHKSQIKTLPPMNSYVQKPQQGIKTLSPQHKGIPGGQVQRTGSGLRTIPPQRSQKIPNKPNYIGKHAVQAQKMRQTHGKMKGIKVPSSIPYNFHGPQVPEKQLTELTFNQALTAQIIETLSNTSTPLPSNRYEILPTRYDNAFNCPDPKQPTEPAKQAEDKSKSGLDALSLICQAVLLDHNYNATLPPDSPTRPTPPSNVQSQMNGISANSMYSPGTKRRALPSTNVLSSNPNLSNVALPPVTPIRVVPDDDAASDISDGSERKHDTEGEETDTAPEAEAVNNEHFDGYGDYVTRCICGFLHDDGYMVECDKCKVWQHVQCVVKNRQVPDEYLCEVCDPAKPIDRQKARMIQQQWLRDRQFGDPKLRKDAKVKEAFKPKETISDSDSSDGERHVAHNNNVVAKGRAVTNRRKSEPQQKQTAARQRRDSAKEAVQRRQKRKERKIVRRKTKAQPNKSHSDDENQDTWASHLPQLRQWIEKYEEAVTNHYSPELRARISSIRVNGAHSDLTTHFDPTVHKCRVHTQPLTEIKYLVSTGHLPPNTPVVELRGKYMLSTQHRNPSGGSLTTRQHSQRPGPFLFFYRLHKDNTEVCVDTRTYGNSARFVRRSCKPNAELRHCIEKGVLHLYVVSIVAVEKNAELTIKHESHDLAAIGTTQIACACGNPETCAVNKTTIVKKNGEAAEGQRKRRGRRTVSSSLPEPEPPKIVKEEQQPIPAPPPPPPPLPPPVSPPILPDPVPLEKSAEESVKQEPVDVVKVEVKEEPLEVKEEKTVKAKEEVEEVKKEEPVEEQQPPAEAKKEKAPEEEVKSPPTPIATRRSSHYKSDKEEEKPAEVKEEKAKCKKLSREERKLEAILRAIEQMEKAESRKQEHQAKQAHRRESEPGPTPKEEEKQEPKLKRRRRKGRARTTSQGARRNRLNSTDSYMTSGDENMLSPNDSNHPPPNRPSPKEQTDNNRAVGLLLALSNGDGSNKHEKSPTRDMDSNSNSAHSSPETPLSSACLLVQAAVEPLEQGFKFPKTKKGLMNEWLNKVPEPIHSASSISPSSLTPHLSSGAEYDTNSGFYGPTKNLATLAQAVSYCDSNTQPRGSAKKRWLRQAISEDHSCDSPTSRPDSPPLSDMVAPPKKRRLPRESLSSDVSPPMTPTSVAPPLINKADNDRQNQEGCVEIVYSGTDGDSPTQTLESDAVLKERAAKMKQEFSKCIVPSPAPEGPRNEMGPLGCLMDPRLTRESHIFSNNDLVGTVEKTLSILGLENAKTEVIPKKKVKLSITEYRQRKKLNNNDKSEDQEPEHTSTEENNSSESFKVTSRPRSGSTSSSTSLTSSDDEIAPPDITTKAPSFNCEPTELERQREISSLRLKKAFGLAVDEEPRPVLNVEAILNLELEPKVKPIPLPSPTFPIPGTCDVTRDTPTPVPPESPPVERPVTPPVPPARSPTPPLEEKEAIDEPPVVDEAPVSEDRKEDVQPNYFYTPDEEEVVPPQPVFEETSTVNYVPPFNNPVYPNTSFAPYTSAIDDDARYEGRNPSPPPNLEPASYEEES